MLDKIVIWVRAEGHESGQYSNSVKLEALLREVEINDVTPLECTPDPAQVHYVNGTYWVKQCQARDTLSGLPRDRWYAPGTRNNATVVSRVIMYQT